MFNRQPFNRGKFNTSNTQNLGANGIALMVMSANSVPANKIINANGFADLYMKADGKGTNVKHSSGSSFLILNSFANAAKEFIALADITNMIVSTQANQTLSGEEMINLEGLVLKPGDELVINTCDMTVTLNGQNGMQYFSSDSDFFSLLNGLNTLEYSDSDSKRNISFDVIWKDRWL